MRVAKSLHDVKKTIMKIEVWVIVDNCNPGLKSCENQDQALYASGTGSVIKYKNEKIILTAQHVCYSAGVDAYAASYGASVVIKAVDRANKMYTARIIKENISIDTCLLRVVENKIQAPALAISTKGPEYGERVFNLAAPLGVINREMVPLFEGHFFGTVDNRQFYSLPSIGGTSGSPIVNSDGELIGMVQSVHSLFHHISVSPSYEELWNFLNN